MSNRKYLCFECRVAIRRDACTSHQIKCPQCGRDCTNIGYKIPVPLKNKVKEWEILRAQLEAETEARLQTARINVVTRKHELEKEILKLEKLPENKGRESLVKKLRKELYLLKVQQ